MDSQPNPNGQAKSFRETDIWTYIYSTHRDWAREIDSGRKILKVYEPETMAHWET